MQRSVPEMWEPHLSKGLWAGAVGGAAAGEEEEGEEVDPFLMGHAPLEHVNFKFTDARPSATLRRLLKPSPGSPVTAKGPGAVPSEAAARPTRRVVLGGGTFGPRLEKNSVRTSPSYPQFQKSVPRTLPQHLAPSWANPLRSDVPPSPPSPWRPEDSDSDRVHHPPWSSRGSPCAESDDELLARLVQPPSSGGPSPQFAGFTGEALEDARGEEEGVALSKGARDANRGRVYGAGRRQDEVPGPPTPNGTPENESPTKANAPDVAASDEDCIIVRGSSAADAICLDSSDEEVEGEKGKGRADTDAYAPTPSSPRPQGCIPPAYVPADSPGLWWGHNLDDPPMASSSRRKRKKRRKRQRQISGALSPHGEGPAPFGNRRRASPFGAVAPPHPGFARPAAVPRVDAFAAAPGGMDNWGWEGAGSYSMGANNRFDDLDGLF